MAVSYARQLPPGGTGQITLKLKTDGKAGEIIRHQATLYTDDPENATILLTMTGKVVGTGGNRPQGGPPDRPGRFPRPCPGKNYAGSDEPFSNHIHKSGRRAEHLFLYGRKIRCRRPLFYSRHFQYPERPRTVFGPDYLKHHQFHQPGTRGAGFRDYPAGLTFGYRDGQQRA